MTYLVDSSVWISYFRGAEHPARQALRQLLAAEFESVAISAPIRMELRQGAARQALRAVETALDGLPTLSIQSESDFDTAADLYRAVRESGHTVRSSIDCLIAAIAERHGVTLVHADADFERIAAVTPGLSTRDVSSTA